MFANEQSKVYIMKLLYSAVPKNKIILIGRSVTIRHYRFNTTTNQLVELEPLDQNLNYDFDFQQFTHLPTPRVVKRVGCYCKRLCNN